MQNIYDIPLHPPEYHHEAIDPFQAITPGMQNQWYEMEVLAEANAVLISFNSAVMEQLAQLATAMGKMQAQLNTLSSSETTITKQKYYCWI